MLSQEHLSYHTEAIDAPLAILERSRKQIEHSKDYPITFSEERGGLPVLGPHTPDSSGVFVVANTGAHLMNSPEFVSRHSIPASREIITGSELASGLSMISHSTTED